MEAVMDMRKADQRVFGDNEKVSVNDFIIKAAALTLRQFPNLNATLKGNEIIQFGHVNVGVAVTVPGGLMTVVVKDAEIPAPDLREIKAMAGRARDGKVRRRCGRLDLLHLQPWHVRRGKFIAIVNPPEAAILAIGSCQKTPVVVNGEIKIGSRMKATISVDHRVSDGAEAAQFMQKLAEFLRKSR